VTDIQTYVKSGNTSQIITYLYKTVYEFYTYNQNVYTAI